MEEAAVVWGGKTYIYSFWFFFLRKEGNEERKEGRKQGKKEGMQYSAPLSFILQTEPLINAAVVNPQDIPLKEEPGIECYNGNVHSHT
jgi:hypothetical protein